MCDECCSVHRSLGRHISIVKHLRHSAWPPTLLQVRPARVLHTAPSPARIPLWIWQLPGAAPRPDPFHPFCLPCRQEASKTGVFQTWALSPAWPLTSLAT